MQRSYWFYLAVALPIAFVGCSSGTNEGSTNEGSSVEPDGSPAHPDGRPAHEDTSNGPVDEPEEEGEEGELPDGGAKDSGAPTDSGGVKDSGAMADTGM